MDVTFPTRSLWDNGIRLRLPWIGGVYLHTSLFACISLIAWTRRADFVRPEWSYAYAVTIALIVFVHELGHVFASRWTGGSSDGVVLHLFGGAATCHPADTPFSKLCTYAGGFLAQGLLAIALSVAAAIRPLTSGIRDDLATLLVSCAAANAVIVAFNLLPIVPLDGSRLLGVTLRFFLRFERAQLIASTIGLFTAIALCACSGLWFGPIAFIVSAIFLPFAWQDLRQSVRQFRDRKATRHEGYTCPACHRSPVAGQRSRCTNGHPVDAFLRRGRCDSCDSASPEMIRCDYCGKSWMRDAWDLSAPPFLRTVTWPAHFEVDSAPLPPCGLGRGLPDGSLIDRARPSRTLSGHSMN